MKAHLLAMAATIALAVTAACGGEEEIAGQAALVTPTQDAAATAAAPSPAAATPATPAPTGTLKYVHPTYGYSFDYPATWFLYTSKDGSTTLYSYDLASVKPEEAGQPVPKDKLKAIFSVEENVTESIEERLARGDGAVAEQGLPTPTVISQKTEELAGRQAVIRETVSEGTRSVAYYVPLGDNGLLIISAVPADSAVIDRWNQTISTLRVN